MPDERESWRLRIRHVTGFTYAGTAVASYNEARMTPQTLAGQTTLFSQVECAPTATMWRYRDYWGSQVNAFDLQRPHQQMRVSATSLVETTLPATTHPATSDPATSDPATPPSGRDWPQLRHSDVADTYTELLGPTDLTDVDEELAGRAADMASDRTPAQAALAIAQFVRSSVSYVPGSTEVHTGAREAWAMRKGVCQDLAHLTAGMLRSIDIPARYVSGYLYPRSTGELGVPVAGQPHAWVEWWVGDWVGFDPTNGVPVGLGHVLVARGRDYADVAPLKGVYHGAPSSGLGVTVEITRLA